MELYERWLRTCVENRGAWAIREETSGKVWTFGAIDDELRSMPKLNARQCQFVLAEKAGIRFILKTLQAWRDQAVLVPLERMVEDDREWAGMPDGVVHVKVTSGSTGEPRRVYFEASQLVADCEQIWETMALVKIEPNLAVVSMAHSYGFSNLVLQLLLKGMPMVILADPLPGTMRRAFNGGERFTLPAVPAMWRAWHQSGVLDSVKIGCAITAGAPMPLDLELAIFEATGLKVHNFYGSSECGGIAYDASHEPRTTASEAGTPMKGVNLEIAEDGCLKVSGPAVALGYDQPNRVLDGGIFKTSDLARLEKGKVFLDGRCSDTIHVAGRKVAPEVIEAALLQCQGVRHCVVFGVASHDSARVEDIVACVNVDEGVSSSALQKELGGLLPSWQVPRRWWQTGKLQPDERGKTPRAGWRERFLRSPVS